ncbi:MAG: hypothetical protein ABSA77_05850 [Thermoguttaceae bacterium]
MEIQRVGLGIPLPTLERICMDCASLVGPQGQPIEEVLASVSEFIFVQKDRFGQEIASALGSITQPIPATDDGNFCLAGKAIPCRGPGGAVTSKVFINEIIIIPIVNCCWQPQNIVEEYRYVISHEIGHSLDYFIRRIVSPRELTADEMRATPFRIHTTAEYHSQRLAFEVAAEINSARAVSADLLSRMYKLTRETVCRHKEFIDRELGKLQNGVVDAREASYLVNSALWSILTDCAQIFATMSANTRFSDGYRHPWVDSPWENILRRQLEIVRTLVKSYPQWPADAMLPVQDVWRDLGIELFNCRFVKGEIEDHVVVHGAD